MTSYKQEVTLNEKDSLQDMLNLEKELIKVYSTALTEGVSKGFRNQVKSNFIEANDDQLAVFLQMTDKGYYRVQSADEETLTNLRDNFSKTQKELN